MRLTNIMMTLTSDQSLVKRAVAGDRQAFEMLIRRHYDMIYRVSLGILGNDAEDITQEICIALPRKLGRYNSQAKFTTWLYKVIVNACRDHLRKQKSYSKALDGWVDFVQNDLEATHELNANLAWLSEIMKQLPEELRETAALVVGEELSHAQAAEILKISTGTVSWRMSEIRKMLKHIAQSEAL